MEIKELSNFIPVNRNIFNHKLWIERRSFSRFEAFLDLIQTARYEDTMGSMIIKGKVVKYNRGQVVASYRFLSVRWGWSTKKVGNFLQTLTEELMIKKETPKETGQTVITICNYDTYNLTSEDRKQFRKLQRNGEETPKKHERNETNKVNIENIENKKEEESVFTPPSLSEVLNYFKENEYTEESARKAYLTYSENNWFDTKGNQVKNWKMKMQKVWFKPENKDQPAFYPTGIPRGFVA